MKRITLKETELVNLIKRVITEQTFVLPKMVHKMTQEDWIGEGNVWYDTIGGEKPPKFKFLSDDNKVWIVSKEWVWQEENVNDQPNFVDDTGAGNPSREFDTAFGNRQEGVE